MTLLESPALPPPESKGISVGNYGALRCPERATLVFSFVKGKYDGNLNTNYLKAIVQKIQESPDAISRIIVNDTDDVDFSSVLSVTLAFNYLFREKTQSIEVVLPDSLKDWGRLKTSLDALDVRFRFKSEVTPEEQELFAGHTSGVIEKAVQDIAATQSLSRLQLPLPGRSQSHTATRQLLQLSHHMVGDTSVCSVTNAQLDQHLVGNLKTQLLIIPNATTGSLVLDLTQTITTDNDSLLSALIYVGKQAQNFEVIVNDESSIAQSIRRMKLNLESVARIVKFTFLKLTEDEPSANQC